VARVQDFLVEIGTEELPPKSLLILAQSFANGIEKYLRQAQLTHREIQRFATPRRLAVRVRALAIQQPAQAIVRLGPQVTRAFDAQGQPTSAAIGFAASCGVAVDALAQEEGPKGAVLVYRATQAGANAEKLLPDIIRNALSELPIAKAMRWGAGAAQFVRPVHSIVVLLGSTVVDCEILGVRAGNQTRGHRFHAPKPLTINSPGRYEIVLRERGYVIADVIERSTLIREAAVGAANALGGNAVIEPALLEEVTALVEWPVAIAGRFSEDFLRLPTEVLIATLQDHQRYFPVRDAVGALMPWFIAIANIDSKDPAQVRAGNERVVRPRLSDAAFFWDSDRKQTLAERRPLLKNVTFLQKLGSLYDKTERMRQLIESLATSLNVDSALAQRAAELSKCDLLTAMVGEFPELQGVMGRYYAQQDGETAEVCTALEEQYRPRFAGDELPDSGAGTLLALADKIDTLAGIFAIGQKPSGTRDPYGLRRAAVGVLRILLEKKLELDLRKVIGKALQLQPVEITATLADEIYDYIIERLRSSYLEATPQPTVTPEVFDAVISNHPASPLDIDARIVALSEFLQSPDAASLAAANKRIANILRKNEVQNLGAVETSLLSEPAERVLFDHVIAMERAIIPLLAQRSYQAVLGKLALLRAAIDAFFDTVLVMVDDPAVRSNRLALLTRLRRLFLHVADFSRLPG
jgi:glycyl-tRNA synthetase beta chain